MTWKNSQKMLIIYKAYDAAISKLCDAIADVQGANAASIRNEH